jgi:hypothetical protein
VVAKTDTVVLFGGVSSVDATLTPVVFGKSWEWDGKHWTQRQDIGPAPRWRHALAFDNKRGRIVLFGGLPVFAPQDPTLPDQVLGDTWEHVDLSVQLLESLVLSPVSGAPGDTIEVRATLGRSAPSGGVTIAVTARGQAISQQLPATISIPEGRNTGQVTFVIGMGANPTPGDHQIDATLGEDKKTAVLTIR